jgi:hypothetical protein
VDRLPSWLFSPGPCALPPVSPPAFDPRTLGSDGRVSVCQWLATSASDQREVLLSTRNLAPVLFWVDRISAHSSLRPALKPRRLLTPRSFAELAESISIARRPRPAERLRSTAFFAQSPAHCRSRPSSLQRPRKEISALHAMFSRNKYPQKPDFAAFVRKFTRPGSFRGP